MSLPDSDFRPAPLMRRSGDPSPCQTVTIILNLKRDFKIRVKFGAGTDSEPGISAPPSNRNLALLEVEFRFEVAVKAEGRQGKTEPLHLASRKVLYNRCCITFWIVI